MQAARCLLVLLLPPVGFTFGAEASARDRFGDALPAGAEQRLGTTRMRVSLRDICYLPDGRAVGVTSRWLHIWDMATGRREHTATLTKAALMSVTPHPTRPVLLLTDSAGRAFEWDWRRQVEVRAWPTGQVGLLAARYSPDGTRVLTSGDPPTVKEWDLATGKQRIAITGRMVKTRCGAIYGPGGRTAILGGAYAHNLEHYDLATGKLLKAWCTIYEAKDLALSPDQTAVLLGVEDRALEWSLADYRRLRNYKHCPGEAARIYAVAYLPGADDVLCGGRDGSIHRWRRADGKRVRSWTPHRAWVQRLRVSPDRKWVLSYGAALLIETSVDTGEPRLKWDRHTGAIQAVAFLPSGRHVVSASADATLRVWDVTAGHCVRRIPGAVLGAYALAVSPDGTRIAAGCKDGVVREFDAASGKRLRQLTGHRGYVRALRYTHDGARLLSSADDGSVRVWTHGRSEPAMVLEGHRGGVLALDVAPADTRAASAGRDATVRLWDLHTGKMLRTHKGHRGWVECVRFLPNAAGLVSAGRDGRILQWRADSGAAVRELAQGGWVKALACTPDGRRLFAAGGTRTVACWDLDADRRVNSLAGHTDAVSALAVSPDGSRLVSGSADTTLLVWRTAVER